MARKHAAAVIGGLLAGAAVVWLAAPAGATFTSNTVGCAGSATITAKNGKSYQINANDAEVKVPKDGSAAWDGSTTTVTHDHSGSVQLAIAFWDFTIGRWGPSRNAGNESARKGTKEIPSFVAQAPPGKYVVSGRHQGAEGGCSGRVTVEIEGSIISNPAGVVSLAGTLASAAGLAVAARAKRA